MADQAESKNSPSFIMQPSLSEEHCMAFTLFYIVGNSDLQVLGADIRKNYFSSTQAICKVLADPNSRSKYKISVKEGALNLKSPFMVPAENGPDTEIAGLSFPIWSALWDGLVNKPDQIILIATDQQEAEFKATDTLYSAELLKLFIQWSKIAAEVIIEKVEQNPSDYDLMAALFSALMIKYKSRINSNIANYMSLSSGTPALIQCLAIATLPYPFDYYYVPRNRPQQVKKVDHYKNIYRKQYAEQLMSLASSYHYSSARKICETSPFRSDHTLITLLKATEARWLYDWPTALQHIHLLPSDLQSDFVWISFLQNNNPVYSIMEAMARIEIAAGAKDIPLVLAYLFNALEMARTLLVFEYAGIRIEIVDGEFKEWNNYVKTCGFFSEEQIAGLSNRPPNRKTTLKVMDHIYRKSISEQNSTKPEIKKLEKILAFLKKVDREIATSEGNLCIQDLRNTGPFAHGFRSVGESVLNQVWPPYGLDGLVNDMKEFVNLLTEDRFKQNPFLAINKQISNLLC
jgi:hypothetical protein